MMDFKEELKKVPMHPGVYIMHAADDHILYVGKAKLLRNRMKSYFDSTPHNERITKMISQIDHFEYILTDSNYEALLLECSLIKKHMPKYNVLLKDDKAYPYIKLTINEKFPRLMFSHRAPKDGARYFGPYYSRYAVNSTIDTLSHEFPMRHCKKNIGENPKDRVCLNYHIGLCPGPCAGYISEKEYRKNVVHVEDFLSGKSRDVVKSLKEEMKEAAAALEFEKAADLRDRIKSLEVVCEKQNIMLSGEKDFDMCATALNDTDACVQVFFVRNGVISGRDFFILEGAGNTEISEIETSFITQFYDGNMQIPRTLYTAEELEDSEALAEALSERAGVRVQIITPKRGEKRDLAKMVQENAAHALEKYENDKQAEEGGNYVVLSKLKDTLGLKDLPLRIEAFDISNSGDQEINGAMTVFVAAKPSSKEYKHYKIKTMDTRNDVGSMKEMLTRRYTRLKNGDKGFENAPDLILMDGGQGQIGAAQEVLAELGLDIPIRGMVKDSKHRSRGLVDAYGREFVLEEDADIWRFVTLVQDETHRFAITYNRKLMEKRVKKSALDEIPGIGEKRKLALLRKFGSISKIREAKEEEIAQTEGIGAEFAKKISQALNPGGQDE